MERNRWRKWVEKKRRTMKRYINDEKKVKLKTEMKVAMEEELDTNENMRE